MPEHEMQSHVMEGEFVVWGNDKTFFVHTGIVGNGIAMRSLQRRVQSELQKADVGHERKVAWKATIDAMKIMNLGQKPPSVEAVDDGFRAEWDDYMATIASSRGEAGPLFQSLRGPGPAATPRQPHGVLR